jgi:hypothetical protein
MSDIETEIDYQEVRDAEMRRTWVKNCDKLFTTIYQVIKNQTDQTEKFYIGPVEFTNGEPNFNLNLVVDEMKKRSDLAVEKSNKAMLKSDKAVPFNPIDNFTIVFHYYDLTNLYHYTNNAEMNEYLSKYEKSNDNPMIDRDNFHKFAFKFYLDKGVIKRRESDDMVFDELL